MVNQLSLTTRIRAGELDKKGYGKHERHFLDFVVDGNSLWERVGKQIDAVSVLCLEFGDDFLGNAMERLLLEGLADAPNNRRTLFVCSECGDLGCGAITLEIEKRGPVYVWQKFGYENDYEDDLRLSEYEGIGPLQFEAEQIENTILNARTLLALTPN